MATVKLMIKIANGQHSVERYRNMGLANITAPRASGERSAPRPMTLCPQVQCEGAGGLGQTDCAGCAVCCGEGHAVCACPAACGAGAAACGAPGHGACEAAAFGGAPDAGARPTVICVRFGGFCLAACSCGCACGSAGARAILGLGFAGSGGGASAFSAGSGGGW